MTTTILVLIGAAIYVAFYLLYGRWMERRLVKADPERDTPAHRLEDGVDFVPARPLVLFGHHFASIAGAAPIIGPAIAMIWGWVPGLLWIWLGNIFIGAVHDYLSLMASVRYDGRSVQWVASRIIRPRTGYAFSLFILFTLILVVAAFAAVIGQTFVKNPSVPTASFGLILVAPVLGFLLYRAKLPFWLATVIGLVMLAGCIVVGVLVPWTMPYRAWLGVFAVYIVVAASIPVNILLQPRDYLNFWLLVTGLALGAVSLIVARAPVQFPAFTSFSVPLSFGGGVNVASAPFWPVIPLIIACGSLSGFHALVASGTSSKQLDSERSGLFVGMGAMFTEGFLSTIVVACIAAFGGAAAVQAGLTAWDVGDGAASLGASYGALMKEAGGPVGVFSRCFGIAVHSALGLPVKLMTILASLWVASFALTTLDTTNRIARYTWTEIVQPLSRVWAPAHRVLSNTWLAASITAAAGIALAWSGQFALIWPAFGGANQMLASVALMTVAVWVIKELRSPHRLVVLVPALVLWLTVTAALAWYLVRAVPVAAANSPVQAGVLGVVVGVMILLNLLLILDFARAVLGRADRE
jgi:carbon starvation protein